MFIKNFIVRNWPYLAIIFIGLLLVNSTREVGLELFSRDIDPERGMMMSLGLQHSAGVLCIMFALYKMFWPKR
ncbi:hypothetical protein [Pseudomonas sp. GD03944]|uniref:hypothetical protein n=1 Tax=Pseudomonas sp. GD03944 TaxID=2975409 RepID=UPI002448C8D0|nr:hypothetical protein [Pseudomonas sp. GD03944]MDH1265264.1 hypothetical protein [Pseudomonas sp. GD03944]